MESVTTGDKTRALALEAGGKAAEARRLERRALELLAQLGATEPASGDGIPMTRAGRRRRLDELFGVGLRLGAVLTEQRHLEVHCDAEAARVTAQRRRAARTARDGRSAPRSATHS